MILPTRPFTIPSRAKKRTLVLLVKPSQEFLETLIGKDFLHRVEGVAQFVVAPRLVNEILARVARRHDLLATFATRHHMMPSRGHLALAEYAAFRHVI
jgi:hypothetical protein